MLKVYLREAGSNPESMALLSGPGSNNKTNKKIIRGIGYSNIFILNLFSDSN